jgi:SulP family sulfate permease
MAFASIAGFDPLLGLYSGMLPTLVGAVFARTVLMATTLTSAIALSSQSVLNEAGLDPTNLHNVATLTLMVGLIMAALGLLRLGLLMAFVSNAVMTGFTAGIALQIVVGALNDATRYPPAGDNIFVKLVDRLTHIDQWERSASLVALLTIAVWAGIHTIKRLESLATVLAMVLLTAGVALAEADVKKVGDIASIPNGLPSLILPDVSVAPRLLVGGRGRDRSPGSSGRHCCRGS